MTVRWEREWLAALFDVPALQPGEVHVRNGKGGRGRRGLALANAEDALRAVVTGKLPEARVFDRILSALDKHRSPARLHAGVLRVGVRQGTTADVGQAADAHLRSESSEAGQAEPRPPANRRRAPTISAVSSRATPRPEPRRSRSLAYH